MSQFPEKEDSVSPANYPQDWIHTDTLNDGTSVVIRPIVPEDAPRLQASFARLSAQSIYLRFLESFKQLPDSMAKSFANLDYQQRMAFVAEIEEEGHLNLIGVARYAMVGENEPGLAEAAIVVVDEYQGRCLGTLLLKRLLAYSRAHGVNAFLATIHTTNAPILRMIKRSGLPVKRRMLEPGVWEVRIFLEQMDPLSE